MFLISTSLSGVCPDCCVVSFLAPMWLHPNLAQTNSGAHPPSYRTGLICMWLRLSREYGTPSTSASRFHVQYWGREWILSPTVQVTEANPKQNVDWENRNHKDQYTHSRHNNKSDMHVLNSLATAQLQRWLLSLWSQLTNDGTWNKAWNETKVHWRNVHLSLKFAQ